MADGDQPKLTGTAAQFVENMNAVIDAADALGQCMAKTTPIQRTFFGACRPEANAATAANARAEQMLGRSQPKP